MSHLTFVNSLFYLADFFVSRMRYLVLHDLLERTESNRLVFYNKPEYEKEKIIADLLY